MNIKDLANYDIFLLIDRSGSMSERDCPNGVTRFAYAQEATEALTRKAAEFDDDGISVVPFNNNFTIYDNVDVSKVRQVFLENEPAGGTDTAKVLEKVLTDYTKNRKTAKPRIILVVTDGVPNDQDAVAKVIINATKQIDRDEELGISFIQVGKDYNATKFLKFLDDNLEAKGARFDIVDTITIEDMDNMSLTDVILNALND